MLKLTRARVLLAESFVGNARVTNLASDWLEMDNKIKDLQRLREADARITLMWLQVLTTACGVDEGLKKEFGNGIKGDIEHFEAIAKGE